MPGTKLVDGAPEPLGESVVERALPAGEGLSRDAVGLRERRQELRLVELVDREREREPVALPEAARRLVPESRELADVVRDSGADRLRGLPRLAPLAGVVALAEEPLDLVVVDLLPADDRSVAREARLDRGLELDDAGAEGVGNLVREHQGVQELEAPRRARVAVRVAAARVFDPREELAIGERIRVGELGLDATLLVLVARVDVRVPPGRVAGEVQRLEPLLRSVDERPHWGRAYPARRFGTHSIFLPGNQPLLPPRPAQVYAR